jgi:hypothetical protein
LSRREGTRQRPHTRSPGQAPTEGAPQRGFGAHGARGAGRPASDRRGGEAAPLPRDDGRRPGLPRRRTAGSSMAARHPIGVEPGRGYRVPRPPRRTRVSCGARRRRGGSPPLGDVEQRPHVLVRTPRRGAYGHTPSGNGVRGRTCADGSRDDRDRRAPAGEGHGEGALDGLAGS